MTELDYAFLAEFAKVQNGLLTSVGSSYTHVVVPKLPVPHMLYVAGRIRANESERPNLSLTAISPNRKYEITFGMVATGLDNVHAYKGKIGILFVASGPIPLLETGFYQVFIDLEGKRVRTLAFDVEISPANQ